MIITYDYDIIDSPVGKLTLIASNKGLRAVIFPKTKHADKVLAAGANGELIQNPDNKFIRTAIAQLGEYFAGNRKDFDVKLDMQGTLFQQQAWRALQKIPYAKTVSYGEQATLVGDAKKARAVGMANGRNPVCIIVPCHRVIGADGSLTGFGGGIKTKQFLLAHEAKHAA